MATEIVIRTGLDRLRYALMFEGLLVAIFSVAMFVMFERGLLDMGAFSVTLSLIALAVNFIYNSIYDRIDVRFGRIPTERSRGWRIVHALGFEFTLVVVNLPIIMWWMQWSFWQALGFDIIAMAVVVIYTYYFTLAYDRVFPIQQPAET
ncbi:MAG: PACE efflux transporter [Woeseiaceae bacterium]|nr:PACE efflux transporter [Woeseiaceae bacterium]